MHRTEQPATRPSASSQMRIRVLGIDPGQASFARRGFPLVAASRRRLEEVGRTFVHGYRTALEDDDPAALGRALERVDEELRGFAYEGAGMGVALRDLLAPWRARRLDRLLAGPGRAH